MVTFVTALSPIIGIYFKLAGKMISALQYSNAPLPNEVSFLGNVTLPSDTQLLNAPTAISVIESGKVRLDNAVHPLKANSPIFVTDSGIIIFLNF